MAFTRLTAKNTSRSGKGRWRELDRVTAKVREKPNRKPKATTRQLEGNDGKKCGNDQLVLKEIRREIGGDFDVNTPTKPVEGTCTSSTSGNDTHQ